MENPIPCQFQSNATVTTTDGDGRTPMHFARSAGNKDVADLLLLNGSPEVTSITPGGHGTLPRARRNSLSRQLEQQTNSALL